MTRYEVDGETARFRVGFRPAVPGAGAVEAHHIRVVGSRRASCADQGDEAENDREPDAPGDHFAELGRPATAATVEDHVVNYGMGTPLIRGGNKWLGCRAEPSHHKQQVTSDSIEAWRGVPYESSSTMDWSFSTVAQLRRVPERPVCFSIQATVSLVSAKRVGQLT